jgi:exosortase A-associated hydrolase 1
MSRRPLAIPCEGATLGATLDEAPGTAALLIVSGGNEIRAGAWAGQAQFAARIAAAGFPVLRFDRRGVGDSDGPNGGFRSSIPDIAAALAALRAAQPQVTKVIAWGNCDAASALMLAGGAGTDALVLSNPWTFEQDEAEEAEAAPQLTGTALKAHYRARLMNPAALKRLLKGQVPAKALARSLIGLIRKPPSPSSLAQDMARGLAEFSGPAAILIAGRDRTALAFLEAWDRKDPRIATCPTASHSFVEARDWLAEQLLAMLRR